MVKLKKMIKSKKQYFMQLYMGENCSVGKDCGSGDNCNIDKVKVGNECSTGTQC